MLDINRKEKVRNMIRREKTKFADLLHQIDQRKWRWTGHMIRDP